MTIKIWFGYPANIASRLTDYASKTFKIQEFEVKYYPANYGYLFGGITGFGSGLNLSIFLNESYSNTLITKIHSLESFGSAIDFKEILTATLVLFAVIDIIGSIPIIIDLRQKAGHIQSKKASLVAIVIMIAFLFIGKEILNLIGIDVNSFAVAGAFALLFLAFEMILGIQLFRDNSPETASVVPLAFPLIAGAGTMTTILSLKAKYQYYYCNNYKYDFCVWCFKII